METIAYRELLRTWADLCGIEADVILDLDASRFNRSFNRLVRKGWDWHRWPLLHILEERRYRAIWMAQAYAIYSEVYHEATELYYRAVDIVTALDVPGASTKWTALADADVEAYIDYEQDGETGFSHVTDVWNDNFRTNPRARRLRWEYDDRGIRLLDGTLPRTVWINLYRRCPRWFGDTWSASSTYQAGRLLYFTSETQDFEGDYWLVLDTTAAAESPITAPDKFVRLEIPLFLAEFIIAGARIAHLKGDGQLEKALAEDGNPLWDLLADERGKLLAGGAAPRRARVANI
jgi:hypothetical protein